MEEFYIEYFIGNKYEELVRKAVYQLLILPGSNEQQEVFDLKLTCSAEQEFYFSTNVFGFKTINFYIDKPFNDFWFKLTATIRNRDFNPFPVSPLLPEQEFESIHNDSFQIDNYLFLSSTVLTRMPVNQENSFPFWTGETQLFDFLLLLNSHLHQLLSYSPESTDVNTPVEDVLRIGKGVCQDFAHVFLSVCRQNKIPARYVSGYLNQGAGYTGSSQLHAWIEAFIPGLRWVGFDPTNNLVVDKHYIKIAHGTDFRDCSPITGVLETSGVQKSTHSVTVTNQ